MAAITLRHLTKHYGTTAVIRDLDLDVRDGEFLALVGPSGCGKSTLLRTIAGLEEASAGDIRLGPRRINDVAPRDRDIAMVFQNYALYPHMTVRANLAFALTLQRLDRRQIEDRVQRAAALLGLGELLSRKPRQLSGGQRQRVAMGRAIVRQPQAFLFDEPLSNLDAKLRVQMRTEIKALHQRLGTTTVFVTHDQVEAMTMADRIVVLRDGAIEQIGTPLEVYDQPLNAFVAGFIGSPSMNFIPGRLQLDGTACVITDDGLRLPVHHAGRGAHGDRVVYGARPEHFTIDTARGNSAEVIVIEPTGAETQIIARFGRREVTAAFRVRLAHAPGERVALWPQAEHALLFDEATGLRLG